MRLQINDLDKHLKCGLSPLFCIAGEEPQLRKEACDALRRQALFEGITTEDIERWDLTSSFSWQDFFSHLAEGNLFAKKRYIECHLADNKLLKEIEVAIKKVLQLKLPDIILVLVFDLDNATLWKSPGFAALEKQSVCIVARPLSQSALTALLKRRFQAVNLNVTDSIISAILMATEGNLTASLQAIEQLKLYSLSEPGRITPEVVEALVSKHPNYAVFELVDAAMAGLLNKMTRIFTHLRYTGSSPALMLWAITQKVRMLALSSSTKKKAYYQLLSQAKTLDAELKTGHPLLFEKLFNLYLLFLGVQTNEENPWVVWRNL